MALKVIAHRIAVPSFTLTETCQRSVPNAIQRIIPSGKDAVTTYYFRPVLAVASRRLSYNSFQFVIESDGAPWRVACLYLLSRLTTAAQSTKTYISIADDLAAFRNFLDQERIDYGSFPRFKPLRPTYRYRGYLQTKTRAGELAPTSAKRRMQSVVGFYRWLISQGTITPEYPAWVEGDAFIEFTGSYGQRLHKMVKTTDVSIKVSKQHDLFDGTIEDGGKLKPLTIEEQETLVRTLLDLGNTEMMLIHLVALFTGARIQTVLTLKVRHVRSEFSKGAKEVRLKCGPGTGVDTKFGKAQILFFPRWLYERLRTYSYSDRSISRRKKSAKGDCVDAYLFLSAQGNPYYQDLSETQQFDPSRRQRYEASGAAIRVFICDRVLPALRQVLGEEFHYQFHDLRATFGMNLTDAMLKAVERGEMTLHQAREFVKSRMNHQSSATTDRYLQYRTNHRFTRQTQASYEAHLQQLVELANSDRA